MKTLLQLIFPETTRNFPYQRLVLDLLRSTHILCVSILLGGLYFLPDAAQLKYWLAGVIASGCGLLAVEIYRSGAVLFEVRGITVLSKLALLLYLPQLPVSSQIVLLMLLVFVSSLSSHSSRRIRHHSLLPRPWRAALNIPQHPTKRNQA
jgi:hypothetical protein